jgi:hypothetical protein
MPRTTTLDDILGAPADAPQVHLNGDGAVVAITYSQEAWDAVPDDRKSESAGTRSVITHCKVRGIVSVDAYVVPTFSAAAIKPWRTQAHARFLEAA